MSGKNRRFRRVGGRAFVVLLAVWPSGAQAAVPERSAGRQRMDLGDAAFASRPSPSSRALPRSAERPRSASLRPAAHVPVKAVSPSIPTVVPCPHAACVGCGGRLHRSAPRDLRRCSGCAPRHLYERIERFWRNSRARTARPTCSLSSNASWRESRASRYQDSLRMIYLAELAQAAADRLDPRRLPPGAIADTHARVWAELGNAYRVAALFDRSEAAFKNAVDALERGSGDPLLAAADRRPIRFAPVGSSAVPGGVRSAGPPRPVLRLSGRASPGGPCSDQPRLRHNAVVDPETAIRYTLGGLDLIQPARDANLIALARCTT